MEELFIEGTLLRDKQGKEIKASPIGIPRSFVFTAKNKEELKERAISCIMANWECLPTDTTHFVRGEIITNVGYQNYEHIVTVQTYTIKSQACHG